MTIEHSDESFDSVFENLKASIRKQAIGPEDMEHLYRLVKPLESMLATINEPPSGDSAAEKIARLLWSKGHLENFDTDFVLDSVRDNDSLIRMIAVTTLSKFVTSPPTQINQQLLFQAQRILAEQARMESSPLLSYSFEKLNVALHKQLARSSHQTKKPPPNPFIAGLPIRNDKLFFGRENLVQQIEDSFNREGVKGMVLFGARRTGKSSLLWHIHRGALGPSFAPVFIDVQSAAGKTALVPFLMRALGEEWPNLVDPLGRDTGDDAEDFDLLRTAVRKIVEHLDDRKLLLLFDEYEVLDSFFRDQASVARMQAMLENEPSLLALFAGPRPLNEVGNRFLLTLLDNCKNLPITYLEPEDAERLIREPAQGVLEFSDAAVGSIHQLCGGHPFYIQLLCQSIFSLKVDVGLVNEEDVETVVKKVIANPPPHLVLTWQELGGNDKLVAAALAGMAEPKVGATAEDVIKTLRHQQYPRVPSKALVHKGLAALRRADLIRKVGEASRAHVFTMDIVRRWIADSRTVWDLLQESRKDVLSRTAVFGRRLAASIVDTVVIWTPLLVLVHSFEGKQLLFLFVPLYYGVLLLVSDRTVAMRLLNLRMVNEDGARLPVWRSLLFSFFLTLESSAIGLAVFGASKGVGKLWWALGALWFFALLHHLQIALHRQHRGFFDRLARVLIIYEPADDKETP